MGPAAILNILVTANTGQAQAALARTDAQLKKTAATANTSSGAMGATIARGAKTGSLAVGALGVASVVAAAKFESSFAEVKKTVEASEKQFDRLEQGLRDLAKQIPIPVGELAELAGQAGALGIKAKDLLKFTKTAAELGIATDLSAEQAANALARLSNIMGTSSKDFRRLGSTMVELGNRSAATESEISEMALRIAGAGKQVGLSEAQVLSYAAALASVGVRAEAGGSAISRAFITMAEAVDKGGTDLAGFAEVAGTTTQSFARLFERDAAQAMILFTEGLEGIRKQGGSVFSVLEGLELNEIRVRDALLRASGAGELFRKTLKTGGEEWKRNTALTEEANRRYETTAAQFQLLKNRVNDLAISLGKLLLPAVNAAMKEIGEGFPRARQALSEFFSDDDAKAFLEAMRNVNKVVLALFRRLWPALKQIFGGLAQGLRGIMRVIAGILTLRFGLAWKGVKDIFQGGVKSTLGHMRAMSAPAREVVSRIGGLMGKGFSKAWKTVTNVFSSGRDKVKAVMHGMGRGITGVMKGIRSAFQGVAGVVKAVVRFIVKAVNKAVSALGELKSKIPDVTPDVNIPDITPWSGAAPWQKGGHITAAGVPSTGDHIPAMLEKDEYVVNSKASKKHRKLLDAINWKDAPRFAKGGALKFALGPYDVPPIQYAADHAGGNSHVHVTGTTTPWVVGIGRKLQRMGFMVGEHPAFGGVNAQHSATGGHYDALAIDVNSAADETKAEVARIARLLKTGAGAGGAFEKIKRILVEGKGPLADMAQAAADKMRKAANKYLSKIVPTGVGPTGGGAMSKSQIARVWSAANRGQGDAGLMAAIALAESAGNPRAVGNDPGGTTGLGLWQITTGYNDDLIRKYGGKRGMFNPLNNAQAAGDLLARQGLGAWVVYNEGTYRNFMKKGGAVPYVGSFDQGGTVAQTGLGLLHKGEEVLSMQRGGAVGGQGLDRAIKDLRRIIQPHPLRQDRLRRHRERRQRERAEERRLDRLQRETRQETRARHRQEERKERRRDRRQERHQEVENAKAQIQATKELIRDLREHNRLYKTVRANDKAALQVLSNIVGSEIGAKGLQKRRLAAAGSVQRY